jgi:hypothetical protein
MPEILGAALALLLFVSFWLGPFAALYSKIDQWMNHGGFAKWLDRPRKER